MPRIASPMTLSIPITLELVMMLWPNVPPRVAWRTVPLPGVKNDAIPQMAKAKAIPPSQRFQYLNKKENFPLQIIQIAMPRAIASSAKPMPRALRMLSHPVTAQLDISGQNQYITPTAIITSISLITGADVIRLMKPFLPFPDFFRGAGLAVLFFLGIALLYLYSGGEYHGAATCVLVKELAQGIFHFRADDVCFQWMTAAMA